MSNKYNKTHEECDGCFYEYDDNSPCDGHPPGPVSCKLHKKQYELDLLQDESNFYYYIRNAWKFPYVETLSPKETKWNGDEISCFICKKRIIATLVGYSDRENENEYYICNNCNTIHEIHRNKFGRLDISNIMLTEKTKTKYIDGHLDKNKKEIIQGLEEVLADIDGLKKWAAGDDADSLQSKSERIIKEIINRLENM